MSWGTTDPAFQDIRPRKTKPATSSPDFTFRRTHLEGSHLRFIGSIRNSMTSSRCELRPNGGWEGVSGLVNSVRTHRPTTPARVSRLRVTRSFAYTLPGSTTSEAGRARSAAPDSSTGLFTSARLLTRPALLARCGLYGSTPQSMWARITALPASHFDRPVRLFTLRITLLRLPTTGTLTIWETNGSGACANIPLSELLPLSFELSNPNPVPPQANYIPPQYALPAFFAAIG